MNINFGLPQTKQSVYLFIYFYPMLKDKFGRDINYLRLAVVDRCNLRCTYCMPENGLTWIKQQELMTDEEMIRICSVFTELGINKIRITGGEPLYEKQYSAYRTNSTTQRTSRR